MAIGYSITESRNFHDAFFSNRQGYDTYSSFSQNTRLTIDGDTRYGPNTSPTKGPFNYITSYIRSELLIDGTNVRLIPFSAMAGTVPAPDTVISQGVVTSKLLGVWVDIKSTPLAAGASLPQSGFFKVRQKAGGFYSEGSFDNAELASCVCSGPDITGWIEVAGIGYFNGNGPSGKVTIKGEWFELGMTTGVRGQTFQAPACLPNTPYSGVFIETSPESDDFRFWPSAGHAVGLPMDIRARCVFCGLQGEVTLGVDSGGNDAAIIPAAGLRVVTGNVLLIPTTQADPANNIIYTGGTQFRNGSGGGLTWEKCNILCGLITSQAAFYYCKYVAFHCTGMIAAFDTLRIDKCGSGAVIGVNPTNGFGVYQGLAPSVITDSNFAVANQGTVNPIAGAFTVAQRLYDIRRCGCYNFTPKVSNHGRYAINAGAYVVDGGYMEDIIAVGGQIGASSYSTWKNIKFAWDAYGPPPTILANSAITLGQGVTLDGLEWLIDTPNTCHPYGILINFAPDSTIRNVGTKEKPLNLGTVNICATPFSWGTYPTPNVKVQNIHFTAGRVPANGSGAGAFTSGAKCRCDNISVTYDPPTTNAQVMGAFQDVMLRGLNVTGHSRAASPMPPRFGSQFVDYFYSDTDGALQLNTGLPMNRNSGVMTVSSDIAIADDSGFSLFVGGAPGEWVQFESGVLGLGHTGFADMPIRTENYGAYPVVSYTLSFEIAIGNNPFTGVMQSMTQANLYAAGQALDSTKGFRIRWRATATQAAYVQVRVVLISTTTTATERWRLYPMNEATLTVTGLVPGCDVVFLEAGTTNVLASFDQVSGTTASWTYEGEPLVDIGIIRPGTVASYLRDIQLTTTDRSIPVNLFNDRNFI